MGDLFDRGRLDQEDQDARVTRFLSRVDEAWVRWHVWIDRAHVVMLAEQKIIAEEDAREILGVLDAIREAGAGGVGEATDTHMAIEQRVIDELGEPVGGQLHTGRSRNDKGTTALRLLVRDEVLGLLEATVGVQEALVSRAAEMPDWLMSGYTHLQNAQPTTVGHYLLGYAEAFGRDADRLFDCYGRVNRNPLGSGAFAGTGFPVDRDRTTELLGFEAPLRNTMDAISDRDFVAEALGAGVVVAQHASRVCEDLIVWGSNEFGLVELADRHAGSSSIMPQKKNPTVPETIRGRAGTVAGAYGGVATTLKGVPSGMSMDLIETGEVAKAVMPEVTEMTVLLEDVIAGVTFDRAALAARAGLGFSTATEVADALVREAGVSFRTAHHIVGRLAREYDAEEIDAGVIAAVGEEITGRPVRVAPEVVERALDPSVSVSQRDGFGGPGEVDRAVEDVRARVARQREDVRGLRRELEGAADTLDRAAGAL